MASVASASISNAAIAQLLQQLESSTDGLTAKDAERRLGVRGSHEPRSAPSPMP